MYKKERIPLDPSLRCSDAEEFETELRRRVVGQEEAVIKTTEIVQKFMAGLNDDTRPVGNVLLLGPTGVGKTRLVEAVCEVMFGDIKGMIRIDCAEYKQSHDTAKIVGAPPGYIGHSDTVGPITQKRLDRTHTETTKLSVILFDEIEKAHENFWELLLGVLDKARLTDSHGGVIDFTHTLIFMTSNLGAREVVSAVEGGIGFFTNQDVSGDRLKNISEKAASKKFTPEFMNRLDQVITFQHLTNQALRVILEIESNEIQKRVLSSSHLAKFVFSCSDGAKEFLLKEGTSDIYGARYLKRTLEKFVVTPLSNFILTSQVELGDLVEITLVDKQLKFHKIPAEIIAESSNDEWKDFKKAIDE
jgi:ATP-dependent Clp protease ATP-binding subunit ClpB